MEASRQPTTDVHLMEGGTRISLVLGMVITFAEHICPTASAAPFVIEAGEHVPGIAPEVVEEVVNA